METTGQAQEVVRELFARYLASAGEMQAGFAARDDTPRAVADYIAGMTDRYACASTSGSPAARLAERRHDPCGPHPAAGRAGRHQRALHHGQAAAGAAGAARGWA
jgi:hypothetical protein